MEWRQGEPSGSWKFGEDRGRWSRLEPGTKVVIVNDGESLMILVVPPEGLLVQVELPCHVEGPPGDVSPEALRDYEGQAGDVP